MDVQQLKAFHYQFIYAQADLPTKSWFTFKYDCNFKKTAQTILVSVSGLLLLIRNRPKTILADKIFTFPVIKNQIISNVTT